MSKQNNLIPKSGNQEGNMPPATRLPQPEFLAPQLPVICAVALSNDGDLIAAGGIDGILRTYDATNGRLRLAFEAHSYPIGTVLTSPNGSRIATNGPSRFDGREEDGRTAGPGVYMGSVLKIWGANTRDRFAQLFPPEEIGKPIVFPSDDRLLFLSNKGLAVWDIAAESLDTNAWQATSFDGGEYRRSLGGGAFSADARRVAAYYIGRHEERGRERDRPCVLELWDLVAGRARILADLGDQIGHSFRQIALSPDGRRVAISSIGARLDIDDNSLKTRQHLITLLDFDSGAVLRQFQTQPDTIPHIHFLAFSPDGTCVVSADNPGSPPGQDVVLRIWNAENGKQIRAYQAPPGSIRAVAFLPNSRLRVVSGGKEYLGDGGQIGSADPLKIWQVHIDK